VTPTSGPIARSRTHHARDASPSRYTLSPNYAKASAVYASRELNYHPFQIRRRRTVGLP
jgi:hypothetical protein